MKSLPKAPQGTDLYILCLFCCVICWCIPGAHPLWSVGKVWVVMLKAEALEWFVVVVGQQHWAAGRKPADSAERLAVRQNSPHHFPIDRRWLLLGESRDH